MVLASVSSKRHYSVVKVRVSSTCAHERSIERSSLSARQSYNKEQMFVNIIWALILFFKRTKLCCKTGNKHCKVALIGNFAPLGLAPETPYCSSAHIDKWSESYLCHDITSGRGLEQRTKAGKMWVGAFFLCLLNLCGHQSVRFLLDDSFYIWRPSKETDRRML